MEYKLLWVQRAEANSRGERGSPGTGEAQLGCWLYGEHLTISLAFFQGLPHPHPQHPLPVGWLLESGIPDLLVTQNWVTLKCP